jgi:hypothetical protein
LARSPAKARFIAVRITTFFIPCGFARSTYLRPPNCTITPRGVGLLAEASFVPTHSTSMQNLVGSWTDEMLGTIAGRLRLDPGTAKFAYCRFPGVGP